MAHCACKRKKLHIVPVIEKMAHCACKRKKGHIFTLTMDLRDTSLGKVYWVPSVHYSSVNQMYSTSTFDYLGICLLAKQLLQEQL